MKYFLIAGEKSGDLHGANLMKSILLYDNKVLFRFVGGNEMEAVGGEAFIHYRELAMMGLKEVLINLRRIRLLLEKCKKEIVDYQPDAVILIDFAGFNLRVAKFVKTLNIKVLYYISPKVWAWNTSRAWKIKERVDKMLVILPFEEDFYKKFNWQVEYVGNPVMDAVRQFVPLSGFLQKILPNSKEQSIIALLPGSRKQEISRLLPVYIEVMKGRPEDHFLVAMVDSVNPNLYESCRQLPNTTLIMEDTYNILNVANAAIVTSGTATLETALFHVPQVVCYKTDSLSYLVGRPLVKIEHISLVNLIAGEKVVEELLQSECTAENIDRQIGYLSTNSGKEKVKNGYRKIADLLGTDSASDHAAQTIFNFLSGN